MKDDSLSYNQKLAMRWKKEHQGIVALATKIIDDYEEDREELLRKDIENLNELTSAHLMDEDVELYKFSMLDNSLDDEIKENIEEFIETFEETKVALMDFLTKYTLYNAVYNQEFIDTFKELVGVLGKRISYEEKNLYKILQER